MSEQKPFNFIPAFFVRDGVGYVVDEPNWLVLTPMDADLKEALGVDTLPFPIAIKLGQDEGGRLICTGLRLGADAIQGYDPAYSKPITSTSLRDIRIAEILKTLVSWNAQGLRVGSGVEDRAARLDPPSHPGRRGHPREFYKGIRDLYREAQIVSPRRTYGYIVEHASYTDGSRVYPATNREDIQLSREGTARKWVQKARKMGLLGPARHGKAGEFPHHGPSDEGGHGKPNERKERQ